MVALIEPATLDEATALAAAHEHDGKLISGGTAVVLMLRQRLIAPEALISLRRLTGVPDWEAISVEDGRLRVGAGVTLTRLASSRVVRRTVPSLAEAARVVGNVRVRNAATLGGNIAEADYASDPPAVLVDLGAEIEVRGPGEARTVPAAAMFTDFYTTDLRPGEIITAVRIPVPHPSARMLYAKYRSRSVEDRPCVSVAASLTLAGGAVRTLSVVVGAVEGTPQRRPEITAAAIGRVPDGGLAEEIAQAYADAVDPLDDVRGSSWYRRQIVRVLVRRSIETLTRRAEAGHG